LVASCKADVGSCVTATDVKPVSVDVVAPSAILVEPLVTELLVKLELAIFDNVLADPLIDVPANVVIVEPSATDVEPMVIELFAN
jgi:hypothetical protein